MSDFSIGGAIGAGAGMIFRKPLSVLLWGLLPLLLIAAALALFGGAVFAAFSAAIQSGAAGAGGAGSEAAVGQAVMQAIGGVMAFVLVIWLGAWVLGAMLTGARSAPFSILSSPPSAMCAWAGANCGSCW